jgi:hypothetical protein
MRGFFGEKETCNCNVRIRAEITASARWLECGRVRQTWPDQMDQLFLRLALGPAVELLDPFEQGQRQLLVGILVLQLS